MKKHWKMGKILVKCEEYGKSQGNLSVRKNGNHAAIVL